ncbi:hypothetical protein RvY_06452 [Ramazzottius varieornatus]|uniref:Uncharacterized protein n=1 Tax=Ramazzottius varieornatus TaxID=947166 RepID=A0A1D1UYM4_RAMVA|nr:hypothetical protein RvY_06452 [Ramazzottius varieornatus]
MAGNFGFVVFWIVSGCLVSAALDASYDTLLGADKQATLWSLIAASTYSLDSLPSKFPQNPSVDPKQLFNASYYPPVFLNMGDEMPAGRYRLFNPYGVCAMVEFVAYANSSTGYTGLFKSGGIGLVRLSLQHLAADSFAPQLAMKILLDLGPSQNFHFNSIAGPLPDQHPNHNYFLGPLSNMIYAPNTGIGTVMMQALQTLPGGPNDRPESVLNMGMYEQAGVDSAGVEIDGAVIAPLRVVIVPNPDLTKAGDPKSINDFRVDIINQVPAGTLLYTIGAQRALGTPVEKIGEIWTQSAFVASQYCDEQLFFRHAARRWVPPFHDKMNHGFNFDVKLDLKI